MLTLLMRSLGGAALACLVASMAAPPVARAEFAFGVHSRVSSMGALGNGAFDAINEDVAYDPVRDRYMVVSQGRDSDILGDEIYGKLVSRTNQEFGPDFIISGTPGTLPSAEPTITFNPARDEFLVVWRAKHSSTGADEIYAQRLAPDGDRLVQNDLLISTTGSGIAPFDARLPEIAYNSATGASLAVWQLDAQSNGEQEIYGRMLSPSGTGLGPDFRISTTGPDGSAVFGAFGPSVAYDSVNHRFLVAWSSDDELDGKRDIYTRLYDGAGSPLTAQKRISDMGPDANRSFDAFQPSLAFGKTSHEYLLVWRGDATGQDEQFEVYGQRLNADNQEVGATDFPISDMGPDGSTAFAVEERPTVEYLSVPNRYLVLWHGDDNTAPLIDGEIEVFGQALAADGQEVGANDFRVTAYGTAGNAAMTARNPKVAYNPAANQTLVVFEGTGASPLARDETEIFSRRVVDDRDGDGVVDGFDGCSLTPGGPFDANFDGCPDDRDGDGLLDELDGCAGVPGGAFDVNRDGCPDDSDGDGKLDVSDSCRTVAGGTFDADANGCPDDRDADRLIDALDRCPSVAGGAIDTDRDGCPDDSDGDIVLDVSDPCPQVPGGPLDTNRNGCPGPFGNLDRVRLSPGVFGYLGRRYVVVDYLRFRDLPSAKVTIDLRCIRRCTLHERLVKRAGPRIIRSSRFKNRRLRIGSRIVARITSADRVGSVRTYEVVRTPDIVQRGRARCIPIGASRAQKTCDRGR